MSIDRLRRRRGVRGCTADLCARGNPVWPGKNKGRPAAGRRPTQARAICPAIAKSAPASRPSPEQPRRAGTTPDANRRRPGPGPANRGRREHAGSFPHVRVAAPAVGTREAVAGSHPEGDVLYHSLQVFELARQTAALRRGVSAGGAAARRGQGDRPAQPRGGRAGGAGRRRQPAHGMADRAPRRGARAAATARWACGSADGWRRPRISTS